MGQETGTWEAFKWFCPNCAYPVIGFKNNEGIIKGTCEKCRAKMVRIRKSRRKDSMEIYAPEISEQEMY